MPVPPRFLLAALVAPAALLSCSTTPPVPRPQPCTQAWYEAVEAELGVLDAAGHGPDIGSAEWAHAVDTKLGIGDGQADGPDPGSAEWCNAVDARLFAAE